MVTKCVDATGEILIKIAISSAMKTTRLRVKYLETTTALFESNEDELPPLWNPWNFSEFVVWIVFIYITPKNTKLVPTRSLPCEELPRRYLPP
jgi:hypothetical protein